MIQERLDEFVFHRTYLRDQPMNVFIMLKLLAKYGEQAVAFYEEDKNRDPWEKSAPRIKENWYRCVNIETENKEEEEPSPVSEQQQEPEQTWELDENNNLLMYNEYGDIEEVYYANSEQAEAQPYERLELVPREDMEILAAEAELNRLNIDQIDPNFSLMPFNGN